VPQIEIQNGKQESLMVFLAADVLIEQAPHDLPIEISMIAGRRLAKDLGYWRP
jgi:hypothetical protein